jgi:hypothetical protein
VIEDVCNNWPALERWSPDYLVEKLGDVEVEVMSGRDADPDYGIYSTRHKTKIQLSENVEYLSIIDRSNDVYMEANNNLLESELAAPLWDDFDTDPRYLDDSVPISAGKSFLWFGPAGTVTPLHHDRISLLFCQVAGVKRFLIFSPLETPFLYNDIGVYSKADPANPNVRFYPQYRKAHPIELIVQPGESLFIPAGWWHRVEAESTSMSISFSSFRFPKQYEWFKPNISRSSRTKR